MRFDKLATNVMNNGKIGNASGQSPRTMPVLWKKLAFQTGRIATKIETEMNEKTALRMCRMSKGRPAPLTCL